MTWHAGGGNYSILSFTIPFSTTDFDLSLTTNFVSYLVQKLDSANINIYSTGFTIENTMVLWQIDKKDFIILDRFNCFETNNTAVPGRCIGCSGPAANQCTECQEAGYSINTATATASTLYAGIVSGYCVNMSCMTGTHAACISCTSSPNTCTGCDPASATPVLFGGTCMPTCPANCQTCSDPNTCTLCDSGFFINAGACVACSIDC